MRILNGRFDDKTGKLTRFPTKSGDSPSLIDYFIADESMLQYIKSFDVLPLTTLSDHCCLHASIKSNLLVPPLCKSEPDIVKLNQLPDGFWSDKASMELLRKILLSFDYQTDLNDYNTAIFIENQEGVNKAVEFLNNIIMKVGKNSCKIRRRFKKQKRKSNYKNKRKWFNDECRMFKSKLNIAKRELQIKPFDQHAIQKFIGYKKKYKKCLKKAEKSYMTSLTNMLLDLESKDSKEFWNMINKMRSWGSERNNKDEYIKVSTWIDHFKRLFNKEKDPDFIHATSNSILDLNSQVPHQISIFTELDFSIKEFEIMRSIKSLKRNKSPGLDNILSEFLVAGKDCLIRPLCKLSNLIFRSHSYPKQWTLNLLKPIHKKESATDPENYRSIAISSCLSKLYSSVLPFRAQEYVEKHNLLSDNQIGFRKGKRTSDHIFILKTLVDKFLRMHKCKLFVAFIDFKKAYDSINRDHLFFKLKNMRLGGLFLENIKAMYKTVEYCIKVHGGFTDPIQSYLVLSKDVC